MSSSKAGCTLELLGTSRVSDVGLELRLTTCWTCALLNINTSLVTGLTSNKEAFLLLKLF